MPAKSHVPAAFPGFPEPADDVPRQYRVIIPHKFGSTVWGEGSTLDIAIENARESWRHNYRGPPPSVKRIRRMRKTPDDVDGPEWVSEHVWSAKGYEET